MYHDAANKNNISFDELASGLTDMGCLLSPSEIHGFLCGQLSTGIRLSNTQWLQSTSELLGIKSINDSCKDLLNRLYTHTLVQLEKVNFLSALLLPDDDEDIQLRAEALGIWCQSFLSGFAEVKTKLSANTKEALKDFSEIAQIESSIDNSEDAEANFLAICEFVRTALLLIFKENNESQSADNATPLTTH